MICSRLGPFTGVCCTPIRAPILGLWVNAASVSLEGATAEAKHSPGTPPRVAGRLVTAGMSRPFECCYEVSQGQESTTPSEPPMMESWGRAQSAVSNAALVQGEKLLNTQQWLSLKLVGRQGFSLALLPETARRVEKGCPDDLMVCFQRSGYSHEAGPRVILWLNREPR
ncbi:hypothetical protein NDU88_004487 [Pleurodeles waltl]|uniref:Uncharacterized protein n=1 Tax=Pleurodeles waltl TaxID=8319 RepID=A0AAV7W978_PLEWA|nr:hypothetical protein NDU88_004487 [Pleurodeles waltl]